MRKEIDKSVFWLLLIPVSIFAILGGVIGFLNGNFVAGLLWGLLIAIGLCTALFAGNIAWEWLQDRMEEGKITPYIILGVLAAIAISSYFALTLGEASCEEYDSGEPRSSCVQYADDGFESSTEERWVEFWSAFPVTVIITSLIATLVHHNIHKKK